ncbi:AAA family ATPase [Mycolicibacterium arenosum]|uniref:AAA family ATPase n=1 Tax=Mycolicibacterium arenosum TaxID=2952157 RepID=A0ABT1M8M0_9MYCO|nr:AAA family ATPase [Mycolicibacterium sp. CAU 1645]MCP9275473.1 AAA family ATPase [Mycolicibacterium sp. CAU 1645]
MTTPLLDFGAHVVGRTDELGQLREAAGATGRAGGGCILISGPPGVGKSTLLQLFGAEVSQSDHVFAYGRCRDGSPAPYAALSDALRSMVRAMDSTGAAESERWRNDLLEGAASLGWVLAELVPELAKILGATPPVSIEIDAADARRRLHRAAIRLVSDTAGYRPVVLAIDDLQWADQDLLIFLSELLTVSPEGVLIVGTHRAGEFDPRAAGIPTDTLRDIELAPLSHDEIEDLLASVTGKGVELGDVAVEFHHRTAGNPLQVRQLLYRAQHQGALIAEGAGGQPTWDLRVLESIEVTATSAEFLGSYLDQLGLADREILAKLTCLGADFDLDDATLAADESPDVVVHALWSALELRLLEAVDSGGRRITNAISRDARYRFSHDHILEAARSVLSVDEEREAHLRVGRRLARLGDDRLFEAARHIGIGGRNLMDGEERRDFVDLLRRAGLKARAQASFPLACEYFRDAVALLGARRWTDHFALSRELQFEVAESAMLVGDVAVLNDLLDEAHRFLSEPADLARLFYLRLKGRVAENRLQDALETGLLALHELGESVPPHPGKPRMAVALTQMKLAMNRWTNTRLLELPVCDDRRVIEVQRILSELRSMSYMLRPNIFPLVVRKQLDLTLKYGHTPSSPLALASYGLLLVFTGDLQGSQRFGEVGLSLSEPEYFPQSRPETMFLYVNFIRHWRHPIGDGLGELRDAVTAALDQGDQEYAGFLAAVLLSQSFWVGRPMAEMDTLAQSLIPEIRSQPAPTAVCQAMQQLCLNLMGRSEDHLLLAGESGFDEREVVPAAREEGDAVTLGVVEAMKQGLHFWAGDYSGAAGAGNEALAHSDGLVGTAPLQSAHVLSGMSMIYSAPHDRSTRRFLRKTIALHRKWAQGAPTNYAASLALLEGAWARACGKHRNAELHLELAIELAEKHQLQLIGAMAYEETAGLYSETGRTRLGQHMLRTAYQRFSNLGLAVRTDRLAQDNPWLLSRDLVSTDDIGVDTRSAHRLVRTLSAAHTADELAKLVLGTIADATGAHRVLFLTGEGEHLAAKASQEDGHVTRIDGPWTELTYDASLVSRMSAIRSPLTTGDPATMVVPIIVQDKIIGAIYAEHNRSGQHFTIDDEHAVALVCAQAAAPLWNFHLEARLRDADEHRQSLMDVQSRFVPNELLRILDIDDLRRVRSGYRVDREMTVLISDIRGYTTMLEDMDVSEASNLAMGFLRATEMPIVSCNGMIQDVRGDEIVAVFESEADAVRGGLAMLRSMREHNRERIALGTQELRAGVGLNTGRVGVTLVGGVNRMVLTIIGDTVNLAARIESTTKRYGSSMLMSGTTLAGLADPSEFDIRRMERVMVVNRRKAVTIYEVYDEDPPELRDAKRVAQPAFDEAFALFDAGDNNAARAAFERCRQLLPDDPVAPLHLAHCDAVDRGEMTPGQDIVLAQK